MKSKALFHFNETWSNENLFITHVINGNLLYFSVFICAKRKEFIIFLPVVHCSKSARDNSMT